MLVISFLLYLILPKVLVKNFFRRVRKNKISKYLITIYLYLSVILLIVITSLSLGYNFYQNYPPLIFIIAFIFAGFLISKFNLNNIINSSLIFFLGLSIFIIYADLSHYSYFDLSEILLIKFDKSIFKSIFILLLLPLDNYIFAILIPRVKGKKMNIILYANIAFFILSIFEAISLSMLFGNSMRGFKGMGYLLYNLKPNFFILENFDFLYIYALTLCAIIKIIFSIKTVEKLHYEKNSKFKYLSLIILLIGSYILNANWSFFINYISLYIYLIIIVLIIFIFIVWRFGRDTD